MRGSTPAPEIHRPVGEALRVRRRGRGRAREAAAGVRVKRSHALTIERTGATCDARIAKRGHRSGRTGRARHRDRRLDVAVN